MQKTWIRPLSREDPLEKGMVTYSSILSWRIPQTEEPMGLHRVGCTEASNTLVFTYMLELLLAVIFDHVHILFFIIFQPLKIAKSILEPIQSIFFLMEKVSLQSV